MRSTGLSPQKDLNSVFETEAGRSLFILCLRTDVYSSKPGFVTKCIFGKESQARTQCYPFPICMYVCNGGQIEMLG